MENQVNTQSALRLYELNSIGQRSRGIDGVDCELYNAKVVKVGKHCNHFLYFEAL